MNFLIRQYSIPIKLKKIFSIISLLFYINTIFGLPEEVVNPFHRPDPSVMSMLFGKNHANNLTNRKGVIFNLFNKGNKLKEDDKKDKGMVDTASFLRPRY